MRVVNESPAHIKKTNIHVKNIQNSHTEIDKNNHVKRTFKLIINN